MRYAQPAGSVPRLYIPYRFSQLAQDPHAWILVTEGEKKSLKAVQEGLACVAVSGIWCWRRSGDDLDDQEPLLPDFDCIRIQGRKIALVYDSDITPEHEGYPAFERLAAVLRSKGVGEVRILTLPTPGKRGLTAKVGTESSMGSEDHAGDNLNNPNPEGYSEKKKIGLDDFLVALGEQGRARVLELIEAAPSYLTPEERVEEVLKTLEIASPKQQLQAYQDVLPKVAAAPIEGVKLELIIRRIKTVLDIKASAIRGEIEKLRREHEQKRLKKSPKSTQEERAVEVLEACKGLADKPNILEKISEVLEQSGLAGERENALILYLAFTSRLQERPINVYINGPSAGGKTFLVQSVSQLFDAECFYRFDASSEKALIYTDQEFKHRVVLIGETTALNFHSGEDSGDSIGATIVRSLVWGNEIRYITVERNASGETIAREIVKKGPTGLCITGTRTLEPELATRVLTLEIKDNPEQTRAVLQATARKYSGLVQQSLNLEPLKALQRWLQLTAPHTVIIPYAGELAKLYDTTEIRARRDFTQLLIFIAAHAVLHQRSRRRDKQGRIVAEPQDYIAIYRLAGAIFDAIVSDGLTNQQRVTIEIVGRLNEDLPEDEQGVSLGEIAKELGISKEAVRKRLKNPMAQGFILNTETHRGKPGRYKLGEHLPNPKAALPSPEILFPSLSESDVATPEIHQNGSTKSSVNPPLSEVVDGLAVAVDQVQGQVKGDGNPHELVASSESAKEREVFEL
ncbi:DUF3854 domain-containing protein [Candidatus Acetothermia bacterium]|nr:DUF3854 domain-containing protein [Candidatus Acetothermia bacterium]